MSYKVLKEYLNFCSINDLDPTINGLKEYKKRAARAAK